MELIVRGTITERDLEVDGKLGKFDALRASQGCDKGAFVAVGPLQKLDAEVSDVEKLD